MISFDRSGLDSSNILGPEGLIAQNYERFEPRPEQVQMAAAVQKAFSTGAKLAVEAGTGVGKSFAYLVPSIDQVIRKNGKVLVSTYTINLQEQLINKDIPFLVNILPYEFTARLAKGRNNYICMRRLRYAIKKQKNLFDADTLMMGNLLEWANNSKDGSLSDLEFTPAPSVWEAVKSEHGNCQGRKCQFFRSCFYWQSRRELETSDIIIGNHALLFSDLILKEEGASLLPQYKYVVLDEAHNLEQAAEDHFGIDFSNNSLTYTLNSLYNPRFHKGLLAYNEMGKEATVLVKKCAEAGKLFFGEVEDWYEASYKENNGRTHPGFVTDCLSEPLKQLRLNITKCATSSEEADDKYELTSAAARLKGLEAELESFMKQNKPGNVYWVELESNKKRTVRLKSAPINVGPEIKRVLFDKYDAVVMTSATLSTGSYGQQGGFGFFISRVGLEKPETLKLGSPFDYEKNVTIYLEDLPEPTENSFEKLASEAIKKYIRLTQGKAFVLFTSYSMLNAIAESLSPWFAEHGLTLLRQGSGVDRTRLLMHFKEDTNSVLFGTESFWQGVDVPGEALSNVIIVRLPFAVPYHPLLQGRLEQIKSEGGNAFFDYQLPQAIIKFKQGFGRLIRTKTDKGIIVILDSRIIHKGYGHEFLSSIPKCGIKISYAKKNSQG